jgi:SAM-dependent methyltransferase
MNPIQKAFESFSTRARSERARLFRENFDFDADTKVLDLGSEDGANIAAILAGTKVPPENVFIADIDQRALDRGKERFGFTRVLLKEGGALAFADGFFDVIYCSSVIEHVTVPKTQIWEIRSGREFRERSWKQQQGFAADIIRAGRQYFVQTPCRSFPVESHTWLPFVGMIPREIFIPVLQAANVLWVKGSIPDFNLLAVYEMQKLFPDARIELEKKFGLTKSIMAIKTNKTEKAETDIAQKESEN